MKSKKLQAWAWRLIIALIMIIWSGAGVVFMYFLTLK